MAARDIDISDVELRRQLKALGEDVGPITDSTRNFLFRKLKRLRNEQSNSRIRKEKTPPRRRTSPGRKSLPATTRNESPSRKRFGFSSDEEDAGPSHSSTFVDPGESRARRRETTSSNSESSGRLEKTKPSPTLRRSNLRQRVPSFIDSVPERTSDAADGNSGEFSDHDGQVYRRPKSQSSVLPKFWRTVKRDHDGDESEKLETVRFSSTYDKAEESVIAESELNTTLGDRQAGAKDAKTRSFGPSTGKIIWVISAIICILVIVLYAALKWHSSEIELLEKLGKNIINPYVLILGAFISIQRSALARRKFEFLCKLA